MKNKLLLRSFLIGTILFFYPTILAQYPMTPAELSKDSTENISSDELRKNRKNIFQAEIALENLLEPSATFINFDDIIFSVDNSIAISPNRYAGVTFYAPGAQTWLTRFLRYSFPNALIVGVVAEFPEPDGFYPVYSLNSWVVDFAQHSKDVSFVWGTDGTYNQGQAALYDNNYQLITVVPVNFNGFTWVSVSLSQYSQRIRRLVLTRPAVINNRGFGHIHLDNFSFTPVTTSSPIGNLDGVSYQNGTAVGWSLDPDSQSASNSVNCYVNGSFIGQTFANLPSPDVPYPGNHRFSIPIPGQYQDANQHSVSCYGSDVTGEDPATLLSGSPRTFRFSLPVGTFESISPEGVAIGISQDPDTTNPNFVDFYVDAVSCGGVPGCSAFAGRVLADVLRPGYGNHGFEFRIPDRFRDGQQHTLYAHGVDTNLMNTTLLTGSPKTFNLAPPVIETTFVALPRSPLTPNNNPGGGLRMFPESAEPNKPVNNRVNVKAKISLPIAGVPVYFRAYDLDDPSTDLPPIDTNGNTGNDNRNGFRFGHLCPDDPPGCVFDIEAFAYKVLTNSNGEATIPFRLTGAHPGDNYAVSAVTVRNETPNIEVDGINLRNIVSGRVLQENIDRTRMLTAWRTLHIERDSMGTVTENFFDTYTTSEYVVGTNEVWIRVWDRLDSGRFQDGRMLLSDNNFLSVYKNDIFNAYVFSPGGPVTVLPFDTFRLYDDDDFNSYTPTNGFDADNGEDVNWLSDSFNLLQANDDRDCSDKICNVFAVAYIVPEYNLLSSQNTSDIEFVLNVPDDIPVVEAQIELGRNSGENDNFWVTYIQISYQHEILQDCDPNNQQCTGGVTVAELLVDDVTSEFNVPEGSQGSLVYIEAMRDRHTSTNNARIMVFPHEIGHQFGIAGDDQVNFGIMGYSGAINFVDRHLNILRWRTKSPGMPRN